MRVSLPLLLDACGRTNIPPSQITNDKTDNTHALTQRERDAEGGLVCTRRLLLVTVLSLCSRASTTFRVFRVVRSLRFPLLGVCVLICVLFFLSVCVWVCELACARAFFLVLLHCCFSSSWTVAGAPRECCAHRCCFFGSLITYTPTNTLAHVHRKCTVDGVQNRFECMPAVSVPSRLVFL